MIKQTDEAGATTQYVYDALGQKIKEIDAIGNSTTYTYDVLGQLVSQQDSSGGTSSVQYDRNGQATLVTDAKNQTTAATYDKDGHLVKTVDLESITNLSYNSDGTVKNVATSAGSGRSVGNESLSYSYDANNNVLGLQSSVTGNTTAVYNKNDTPTQISNQAVSTSYSYDANGNIASVSNTLNNQVLTTKFSRDAEGKVTAAYKPNGDTVFYTFDSSNRPNQLTNRNVGKALLSQYNYKYDKSSNILAVKESMTGQQNNYTYDVRNQLVQDNSKNYTYDLMGNRQTITDSSGTTKYSYDTTGDANRLISITYPDKHTIQFQYDANGNVIKQIDSVQGTTLYAYDSDDYFTKATLPSGATVQYQYDKILKLRTARIETSPSGVQTVTKFTYSGDKLVSETDQNGKILRSYNWDNNEKLISISLPDSTGTLKTFTYQKNLKDDATQLTDQSGNIVAEYQYDAWGNVLNSKTTAKSTINNLDKLNPRLYSSYWYDSTLGLYFMKTRMYNSTIGRFLSKDANIGGSSLSQNPYIYCYNNPVRYIDPSGKIPSGVAVLAGEYAGVLPEGLLAGPIGWGLLGVALIVGIGIIAISNTNSNQTKDDPSDGTGNASDIAAAAVAAAAVGVIAATGGPGGNHKDDKNKKNTSKNYKQNPQPGDSPKVENAKPDPNKIAENLNRFFKKGGSKATDKIIQITADTITARYTIPGWSGEQARATYQKVIDYSGETLLYYKNSFNAAGEFVSSKIKYIIDLF